MYFSKIIFKTAANILGQAWQMVSNELKANQAVLADVFARPLNGSRSETEERCPKFPSDSFAARLVDGGIAR
jgi:hypothetical protein